RAEGYYWIAANNGALAKHIGVIEAVSQGLGGTIERAALKALELDRTLYGGSVLRLLGRYYTLIPWPLRNTDKAVKLLTEAHELMPANMAGVQFLAEALTLSGDKDKARPLYALCAKTDGVDPEGAEICKRGLADL
ncbi:MAG: hypothetical protein ACI9WU_002503, partial [Myxococcota bacterium]